LLSIPDTLVQLTWLSSIDEYFGRSKCLST